MTYKPTIWDKLPIYISLIAVVVATISAIFTILAAGKTADLNRNAYALTLFELTVEQLSKYYGNEDSARQTCQVIGQLAAMETELDATNASVSALLAYAISTDPRIMVANTCAIFSAVPSEEPVQENKTEGDNQIIIVWSDNAIKTYGNNWASPEKIATLALRRIFAQPRAERRMAELLRFGGIEYFGELRLFVVVENGEEKFAVGIALIGDGNLSRRQQIIFEDPQVLFGPSYDKSPFLLAHVDKFNACTRSNVSSDERQSLESQNLFECSFF